MTLSKFQIESQRGRGTFPSYKDRKPRIFLNDMLDMSFMNQRVFRSSPSTVHASTYLKWITNVEAKKAQFLRSL